MSALGNRFLYGQVSKLTVAFRRFICGLNNLAAVITPAAKPSGPLRIHLLKYSAMKTREAPKAVIPQVKIVAIKAFRTGCRL
jgi:hypothetical protein